MTQKYAYVTLLYLSKHKQCNYFDGALLTGIGLRKQKTKHKIICMITKDIDEYYISALKLVYDEIIYVDYISPIKSDSININPQIFTKDDYDDDDNYSDICRVFTKLHIFDKTKFPYDKIVFIDSDIIPLKKYDELFELNTPAGWVEQISYLQKNNFYNKKKFFNDRQIENIKGEIYERVWGVWDNISHGEKIDRVYTDIYKIPGSCVNAGLLVISPDTEKYNFFLEELKKPVELWMGKNHLHKGIIDTNGQFLNKYKFPEQAYLTQHFSGQWYMIDGKYAMWGYHIKDDIYGLHMAGLKYYIDGKWNEYKAWNMQIPIYDGFNYITNIITKWGVNRCVLLKKYMMKNLHIYINDKKILFFDIKRNDAIYDLLTEDQKKLHDILVDSNK
jgi:lipopolysaccharide biosynthesis glycosyltransferase